MAKVIQVIEADVTRGKGTEGDVFRSVKQIWTFDGELLAETDPVLLDGYFYKVPENTKAAARAALKNGIRQYARFENRDDLADCILESIWNAFRFQHRPQL